MMKKLTAMMLTLMILAAPVCFAEHTHAPTEEWDRNLAEHWRVCECGEKLEAEAHVLEDDILCTVCGSEIWLYGEEAGPGDIYNYNEIGDMVRYTSFDENGEVVDDSLYLIEYDEAGNKTYEEDYWNGMLSGVIEYALDPDGYAFVKTQTSYEPDGGRSISECDDRGNTVHSIVYDADEAVVYEDFTEYTYDEEGLILYTKQTGYFDGVLSFLYEFNEFGDKVNGIFYADDGSVEFGSRSEYEYDEDGNMLWEKNYDVVTGRQTQESIYAVEIVDDWPESYEKTFIYYEEDGSKSVYENDVNGYELSETVYNAEGEIETVYRNEYEFDENGNELMLNRYENERLCLVVQYDVIETEDWGCHYEKIRTEIFEDGTMYICEYDMDGNEISAGLFDANGDPIPEEEADGE